MDGSGRYSVDFHLGVGHYSFEDDTYLFVFPFGRYFEFIPVQAVFAAGLGFFIQIKASVGIFSESLLFPL